MEVLSLGQRKRDWQGFPDGYLMSYDTYNGLTLFFFLENPPEDVLREIGTGHDFEITLADIEKVGFFTLRFGALPYGDCAFAPSLFSPPRPIDPPAPGGGVNLNVIVVDSAPGEIVYMRTITLGYEFSVKLANWFQNRRSAPLSLDEYGQIVRRTYARYDTQDLRSMANIAWHMVGG